MATRNAIELAKELLAIKPAGGVEGIMASGQLGCGQYGAGGFDDIKGFYAKHRTPVMAVGAVLGVALVGWVGYAVYKKWMWTPPLTASARDERQ